MCAVYSGLIVFVFVYMYSTGICIYTRIRTVYTSFLRAANLTIVRMRRVIKAAS